MAMTKKKIPSDTILKVGALENYKSSMEKGKGPSKKQAVKESIKAEGGLGAKKEKEITLYNSSTVEHCMFAIDKGSIPLRI